MVNKNNIETFESIDGKLHNKICTEIQLYKRNDTLHSHAMTYIKQHRTGYDVYSYNKKVAVLRTHKNKIVDISMYIKDSKIRSILSKYISCSFNISNSMLIPYVVKPIVNSPKIISFVNAITSRIEAFISSKYRFSETIFMVCRKTPKIASNRISVFCGRVMIMNIVLDKSYILQRVSICAFNLGKLGYQIPSNLLDEFIGTRVECPLT